MKKLKIKRYFNEKFNTFKNGKKNAGITLVALIITIVILIILSAVVITNVLDNGTLKFSEKAGERTIVEKEKELITLSLANIEIDNFLDEDMKSKQNQKSGYEIETGSGNMEMSVFANSLAKELNKQSKTLDNTLKLSMQNIKIATTNPVKIAATGTYQLNKNGILVWDYDKSNDEDYVLSSDWVKVKFENTKYNNMYIVNKWSGKIIEGRDLYKALFPLDEPGNYYCTVDAGTKAKWVYMKKFDERIPDGANIKYRIFVSDDKETWKEYPTIADIDKFTRYIRINIELIPNSAGVCPRLGGLTVKFKRAGDIGEDIGEVNSEETSNILSVTNGYKPENLEKPATLSQIIKLSTPMNPSQIESSVDVPIESNDGKPVPSGYVSNNFYVSNDGKTWVPIENAEQSTSYYYVKVNTTISRSGIGNSGTSEEGGSSSSASGSAGGTSGTSGETSYADISNIVIGIASVNPQSETPKQLEVEIWKTIDTRYYYAIADGPAEWIKMNVDETIPEGTRIKYYSAKSNDGDNWTAYSNDITENNDSDYVKVKVDFQTKDISSNEKPLLNSLEIVCNYNGKEITHKPSQQSVWNFSVASQNTNYGTVSNNSGTYKYKTPITVTATPITGYTLIGWSDGKNIVSKEQTYTFNMPKSDYSLNAIWMPNTTNLGEVIVYDEHTTFVVVKNGKTWKQAQEFAKSYGGRLAVVDNAKKQALIYSKVKSVGDAWIGATDEAQEGVWLYTDGRPLTYSNWNGGEPNNSGGNEDYAEMYMSSGRWNDLNGSQSYPFIIEFNN